MIVIVDIMNAKMIVNIQLPEFTDEVIAHKDVITIIISTKRMFMAWILIPMMNRGVVLMQYT